MSVSLSFSVSALCLIWVLLSGARLLEPVWHLSGNWEEVLLAYIQSVLYESMLVSPSLFLSLSQYSSSSITACFSSTSKVSYGTKAINPRPSGLASCFFRASQCMLKWLLSWGDHACSQLFPLRFPVMNSCGMEFIAIWLWPGNLHHEEH